MSIHGILLSSGASARFGGNKLFYPVKGVPMYRRSLDLLSALRDHRTDLSDLVVVSRFPELREAAEALGFRAVDNPRWREGVSASIRLGLEAALKQAEEGDWFFFLVGDQPWLRWETVDGLLTGVQASGLGLGCLCCGDTPGNPGVFSWPYVPQLLALTGDQGGRRILKAHPGQVYLHPAEERELLDVDTPSELPGKEEGP